MLSYYLTAAVAFTLGFLVAGAFLAGRREASGRDRAWLADVIEKFTATCKSRPHGNGSTEQYLVERKDLESLEDAVRSEKRPAKDRP
ncbi:MAG: hypothetical protein K8U03_08055 [Planctomycetia bacterium]|nr:hypothetical protein [Planctomycetia bacterium]